MAKVASDPVALRPLRRAGSRPPGARRQGRRMRSRPCSTPRESAAPGAHRARRARRTPRADRSPGPAAVRAQRSPPTDDEQPRGPMTRRAGAMTPKRPDAPVETNSDKPAASPGTRQAKDGQPSDAGRAATERSRGRARRDGAERRGIRRPRRGRRRGARRRRGADERSRDASRRKSRRKTAAKPTPSRCCRGPNRDRRRSGAGCDTGPDRHAGRRASGSGGRRHRCRAGRCSKPPRRHCPPICRGTGAGRARERRNSPQRPTPHRQRRADTPKPELASPRRRRRRKSPPHRLRRPRSKRRPRSRRAGGAQAGQGGTGRKTRRPKASSLPASGPTSDNPAPREAAAPRNPGRSADQARDAASHAAERPLPPRRRRRAEARSDAAPRGRAGSGRHRRGRQQLPRWCRSISPRSRSCRPSRR